MAIFVVSFLVFVGAGLLLVLSQRARGGQLPVGCTPESGECCRSQGFGKCIEPSERGHGNLNNEGVRQWPASSERP